MGRRTPRTREWRCDRSTALGLSPLSPAQIVAAGTTITVTTAADDTATNGTCSLREAISAANTDHAVDACPAGSGADTIIVPARTYVLGIAGNGENANTTGDLDITSNMSVRATGAIVDGGAIDRVVEVMAGATVTITGGTIRNGSMTTLDSTTSTGSMGAGIHNAGTLTLDNVTVSGNVGDYSPFQGRSAAPASATTAP